MIWESPVEQTGARIDHILPVVTSKCAQLVPLIVHMLEALHKLPETFGVNGNWMRLDDRCQRTD